MIAPSPVPTVVTQPAGSAGVKAGGDVSSPASLVGWLGGDVTGESASVGTDPGLSAAVEDARAGLRMLGSRQILLKGQ